MESKVFFWEGEDLGARKISGKHFFVGGFSDFPERYQLETHNKKTASEVGSLLASSSLLVDT